MSEKNINDITIKDSYDPIIIYPDILKLCPEINYGPLYVCDKSVIESGTMKNILGFFNTDNVDSRYIYPI